MEHDHGDSLDWSMERRVEGLVNKHMADIAVESLQQRLTAVSDEMHSLVEHVSRRSGEEFRDESRRGDVSLGVEPQLFSACSSGSADKLISAPATETAAQRKIIALLVEIKDEQQRQWAVLRDLQARLQGQTGYEEEDVEALDMDLPLRTLEQLDEMERRLEEPGIQKKMVSFLSRMGGATIDDAVRRLMQAVLSFAVGSELNWVGRGQKRSFRNTRLQGVLFRALKRTPVGKEATHHQYADVVKKWLRFAPFRQGGSGRRCCKPPVESPDSEEVDSFNQSCTH
ncbi:uncharacterized protein LOC111669488 isoform X1 [Seriola lalandi dorsalis]|uniref:Uncharacterized LOC111669488 n=1 Tax=Seriola lalandi dorsalis TaxID=1841481 RepID=A0A3B4YJC3_SERLL|nr:uncharacterized protein LOC111669488 isoform X1 [Seriola lalandi dorsalis]XP_056250641.1 uncharacterized protein LOC130180973 isoform X1 [Seriola aureovittata]